MAEEMKLLCIHPALAPYRLDFFNLLAERVELKVAFVYKNTVNQKFDQKDLLTKARFDYCYLSGFDVRGRGFRFGIRRLIRQFKPDVVMGYEASPITLWLCIWRKLSRAKWRLWTSMDEAPDTILSRRGFRRKVRDWVIRHCDGIMVPSAAAAEAYRSVLVPHPSAPRSHPSSPIPHLSSPKFAVVPIIHDTATIRKNADSVIASGVRWRTECIPHGWRKLLLFVGRLTKVKNLHWLIGQMQKFDESIGLVLVGGGDEESSLRAEVEEFNLSQRVVFAGKKMGEELYAIMSAADALVLTSTFEPYGAVVPEAMQWGTPCIVRDTCGCKVLVDGTNGAVYHSDDEFEDAVRKVLTMGKGQRSILTVDLGCDVDRLSGVFDRC